LLFFNALPAYRPGIQVGLLDLWFGLTVLYFVAGALILAPHGVGLNIRMNGGG